LFLCPHSIFIPPPAPASFRFLSLKGSPLLPSCPFLPSWPLSHFNCTLTTSLYTNALEKGIENNNNNNIIIINHFQIKQYYPVMGKMNTFDGLEEGKSLSQANREVYRAKGF
jgi:hypothetical protein